MRKEARWFSYGAVQEFLTVLNGFSGLRLDFVERKLNTVMGTMRKAVNDETLDPSERVSPSAALRQGAETLKDLLESAKDVRELCAESALEEAPAASAPATVELEDVRALIRAGARDERELDPRTQPRDKGKGDKERKAKEERDKRQAERRAKTYTDDTNKVWKSAKGGNDEADKCTEPGCFKDSWCPYSHKHMKV